MNNSSGATATQAAKPECLVEKQLFVQGVYPEATRRVFKKISVHSVRWKLFKKRKKFKQKKMSSAMKLSACSVTQRPYNIFGHQLVNMYITPLKILHNILICAFR